MFDISFWELVVVAVVALLVAGPERLPGLIREAARWFGAIRRFVMQTKVEIERELDLDLKKDLRGNLDDLDELMNIAPDKHTSPEKKKPEEE